MTACKDKSAIDEQYVVECKDCRQVWQPALRSPLWWLAKQRADKGKLDAPMVSGEKCGCIRPQHEPNAQFRVFGYNDLCEDFDIPCHTFTAAVRKYRDFERHGGFIVFISGVSDEVRQRIDFGF